MDNCICKAKRMCGGNSIDKIISYIAGYDTTQGSLSEIDTEKEYQCLGRFLNGSEYLITGEDRKFRPIITKYTDLFKEGKERLFAIMNSLRSRFGEWTNAFAQDCKVDDKNVYLYADRLYGFKTKLEELRNCDEEQYQRYYEDNIEEMEMVESKLKEYCEQAGLVMPDYGIENLEKLVNTCDPRESLYYRNNEVLEFKNLLVNSGNEFVMTDEIAEKYMNALNNFTTCVIKDGKISIFTDEQTNNLKTALFNYLKDYISPDELADDEILNKNFSSILNYALRPHNAIRQMEICDGRVQHALVTSHKDELKGVVDRYISDNNIQPLRDIPEGVDMGGDLYATAVQETDTCWAHGDINSLISTETGAGLINNNYYRDENTGVFAIHLQEAEDLGLHGGVYMVTPQDIIDSQDTFGRGNGIISAYLIATQKYFDEVNSNPELAANNLNNDVAEGNYGYRFYEILTGGDVTNWSKTYLDTPYNNKVRNGIGTITCEKLSEADINNLYQMIEQGNGAMTIAMRIFKTSDVAVPSHTCSVVGARDGRLLIQESMNFEDAFEGNMTAYTDTIEKLFIKEEERINGRPTYSISTDNLTEYDLYSINYIKWE